MKCVALVCGVSSSRVINDIWTTMEFCQKYISLSLEDLISIVTMRCKRLTLFWVDFDVTGVFSVVSNSRSFESDELLSSQKIKWNRGQLKSMISLTLHYFFAF